MAFTFIYGGDDYLVAKAAAEAFARMKEGCDPEFGVEIIDGRCLRVEEAEEACKRLREAAQTVGLFGGARAVWLKSASFLAGTVLGQSQGVADALEGIKETLAAAKDEETRILISATPVDKRLSFFKWASKEGAAKEVASLENLDEVQLASLARKEGLTFDDDAAEIFLKKVGVSARAVENELQKLSLYFTDKPNPEKPQRVSAELVLELTSEQADENFFEPLEAFYSRRADWALESVERYFRGKDASARPLIASFFNRNRLLMLLRGAMDEGLCKAGFKGITWTSGAEALKAKMGAEKTPFNIFAQNPWYLGNLAKEAGRFTLKELEEIQMSLYDLFEKIHEKDFEETAFTTFFARYTGKSMAAV